MRPNPDKPASDEPSPTRDARRFLGFGAAACAACCAGPIIGFVAAAGAGTLAALAWFGGTGLVGAGLATAWFALRRRRRFARS